MSDLSVLLVQSQMVICIFVNIFTSCRNIGSSEWVKPRESFFNTGKKRYSNRLMQWNNVSINKNNICMHTKIQIRQNVFWNASSSSHQCVRLWCCSYYLDHGGIIELYIFFVFDNKLSCAMKYNSTKSFQHNYIMCI